MFQEEPLSRYRDILNKGHLPPPPVIQLSALNWYPWQLPLHCILIASNLDSEIKSFSTPFTSGLYQESAFLMQATQRRLGLVDSLGMWTNCLVQGGFRNWCLWLFMSHCICIKTPVWTILTKAWLKICQSASVLSLKPSLIWKQLILLYSHDLLWQNPLFSKTGPSRPSTRKLHAEAQNFIRQTLFPFLQMWIPLTCWH